MELLLQTHLCCLEARSQRTLAVSGVVLVIAALLMSVGVPAFLEAREAPPKALSHVITDSAHRIKDHLAHQEIETQPAQRISWKVILTVAGAFTGFLGAALGTASWIRRQDTRLSSVAIGAGLTAIAWNYFLLAAVTAIGLFVLAWIVSHFHR